MHLTLEQLDTGLEKLCVFYGKKTLLPEQVGLWYEKLNFLDPRDFSAAVDQVTSSEKFFPTPQLLLKLGDEARQRRRSKELEQDKNQAREFFNPESHKPGIGKDCVAFYEALESFHRESLEKLEFEVNGYKALMKKYPTAGFEPNYRDAVVRLNKKRPPQAA